MTGLAREPARTSRQALVPGWRPRHPGKGASARARTRNIPVSPGRPTSFRGRCAKVSDGAKPPAIRFPHLLSTARRARAVFSGRRCGAAVPAAGRTVSAISARQGVHLDPGAPEGEGRGSAPRDPADPEEPGAWPRSLGDEDTDRYRKPCGRRENGRGREKKCKADCRMSHPGPEVRRRGRFPRIRNACPAST